jgi:uncharacterized membrane protein
MDEGYWVIIGFVAFIAIVSTILVLNVNGFFDRFKKKK